MTTSCVVAVDVRYNYSVKKRTLNPVHVKNLLKFMIEACSDVLIKSFALIAWT